MIHESVTTLVLGDSVDLIDLESDIQRKGVEALTIEWHSFEREFTVGIKEFLGTDSIEQVRVNVYWVGKDFKDLPEVFDPQLPAGLHIITQDINTINLSGELAAYLITLIGPGQTSDVFTVNPSIVLFVKVKKTFIALNGKDYFFSQDHLDRFEKKLLFHNLNDHLNLAEASFLRITINPVEESVSLKVRYLYKKNNHLLDILRQRQGHTRLSLVKSIPHHGYQVLDYNTSFGEPKKSKISSRSVTTARGRHSTHMSTEQAFHPVVRTQISDIAPLENCNLNAVYTIPKSIFIDKYQLSDQIQTSVGGLQSMIGIWGERDLEAPVWKVHGWGSVLVLQVKENIDVPMHLRYQLPNDSKEDVAIEISVPQILWVCPGSPEISNDHLIASIFGSNNLFHFIPPASLDPLQVLMPTVHNSHYALSQIGTALGIFFGFFYLLVRIYTSKMSPSHTKTK
ncbi:Protein pbn1 [Neolecta irregularis DAH-3]|uniref:Protein PBN1 n=1 Tax=Neolecta irregularis (strain DAH-3) TaxID=1198029 RepID=A0A1U7LKL5_NEOID|nr:Protein pbn1 [Neolecta irregularis DAH-3]|eukprot:OLL23178.1 Protein pbn1 [Neolecta irregularis DAH-3]